MPFRSLLVRLSVAVGLIALYLAAAAAHRVNPPGATVLVSGVLLLFFALFVLWRGPRVALNRAFFYLGLALTAYLTLVSLLHLATGVGLQRVEKAVWVLRNGLLLAPPVFMYFTYRFVGGDRKELRLLAGAALASMAPFLILNLLGLYVTGYRRVGPTYTPTGQLLYYRLAAGITMLWSFVSAAIVLRECFRPEQRSRRIQLRLFLVAWSIALGYALLGYLPAFDQPWFPELVGPVWSVFVILLGFGVLRFNLFDIKVVVRRTLPYAAGTVLLGALYAACLIGLEAMGARLEVLPKGSQWVIFLLLVGLAFQPVLELLQSGLDRLFFRAEAELDRFLAEAGARYHRTGTRGELALMLARDARAELRLQGAAVLLGAGRVEVAAGDPREPAWGRLLGLPLPDSAPHGEVLPLDSNAGARLGAESAALADGLARAGARTVMVFSGGGTRGILACRGKLSDLDFTPRDRRFLAALAAHAGAVLGRLDASQDAEAAHRLTEAVFDSMTNAVVLLDAGGRVLSCNGAFTGAFGVSEDQKLPPAATAMLAEAVGGGPREIDTPHGCFLVTARRLPPRDVTLAVFTDITELRRLQEADRRQTALAEIGATVSAINHEIGNILTPLTYNLGKAAQASRPEDAARAIAVARDRAAAMERLSRELREFYREPQLTIRSVSLAAVVDSTLADLRGAAGDAWTPPELGGLDLQLRADIQKLKQVLLNLAKNAWEAMEKCPARTWSITAAARDGRAEIRVRDCGPGIPPELLKSLFRPFFTTKKERGTGLGLAVARRIAEAHGAEIAIGSAPGRGTEATLSWPLA